MFLFFTEKKIKTKNNGKIRVGFEKFHWKNQLRLDCRRDRMLIMDCCWNIFKNCGCNAGGADRQNRGKFHRFMIDIMGFWVFLGFFFVFFANFRKIFQEKKTWKFFFLEFFREKFFLWIFSSVIKVIRLVWNKVK